LGGGRNASLWWKDVCEVREGVGGVWGGGLRTILGGRWGAENHNFFWKDRWLVGNFFCLRIGRLFELSVDKNIKVAELFRKGWRARVGDGVCVFLRGRRSWLGSVVLFWNMFF
jgi:hypothetical protein